MIHRLRYRFGPFLACEAGPDRTKDWPAEYWFSFVLGKEVILPSSMKEFRIR